MPLTLHGIGTAVPPGSVSLDDAVVLSGHVSDAASTPLALLHRIQTIHDPVDVLLNCDDHVG